jgi:hypothetical protein
MGARNVTCCVPFRQSNALLPKIGRAIRHGFARARCATPRYVARLAFELALVEQLADEPTRARAPQPEPKEPSEVLQQPHRPVYYRGARSEHFDKIPLANLC